MCEPPGNSARTTALWSAQARSRDYPMSTYDSTRRRKPLDVRLAGRTAMITGFSKGLSLAMAKEFAASGANVAIMARGPESLAKAQAIASEGASGTVATFQCDVSKAGDINITFDAVIGTFGRVDIFT